MTTREVQEIEQLLNDAVGYAIEDAKGVRGAVVKHEQAWNTALEMIRSLATLTTPTTAGEHTTEEDFQHFLAYTGWSEASQAMVLVLRYAYFHGADSAERAVLPKPELPSPTTAGEDDAAEEREVCEASTPEKPCGPVVTHDSEGIPLCAECAWSLDRSCLEEIGELVGFDEDKHSDLLDAVRERLTTPAADQRAGGTVDVCTPRPNDTVVSVPIGDAYLIWSYEHGAWWGPKFGGYFVSLLDAGLYTKEAAERECGKRYAGQRKDEEARRFVDEIAKREGRRLTVAAFLDAALTAALHADAARTGEVGDGE